MSDSIVILGNSGHACVVADILESLSSYQIVGCLSPDYPAAGIPGVPILGTDDRLPELVRSGVRYAVVAVGDNRLRLRLADYVEQCGIALPAIISPWAHVSPRARIGAGTVIMPGAMVNTGSDLGRCVIVNTGTTIDHDNVIGDGVHIAPGCHLAGGVRLGDGVFLGVGCCVIPRRSIGAWTIVGAGAAVTTDLPDGITAVGVPARALADRRTHS